MSQHSPAPPSFPSAEPSAGAAREPRELPSPAPPHDERPWWRRSLAMLVVVGLLALKFGKAALLLLPKAKVLTTSTTMLVSIAAYSLFWGWRVALGFVVLLFVHEMGHVIQLRREGIEASAPMFIPFLGAAVMAKSLGDDATAEARVGLAGPILGVIGCLALLPIAIVTGEDFWYALIFTGLFLNLFNLLPVVPLDGGRAMAALSPRMWFVGLFAMVLLAVTYPNPVILLIVLLAGFETYRRW
ncbi:MAG: site-2 protease family protein, partial [Solirubrobacteraceae bacterium]